MLGNDFRTFLQGVKEKYPSEYVEVDKEISGQYETTAIVAKLNDALQKTQALPQVKEEFAKVGVEPFTQSSPEAFRKFLDQEIARWGKIARDSGAKAN